MKNKRYPVVLWLAALPDGIRQAALKNYQRSSKDAYFQFLRRLYFAGQSAGEEETTTLDMALVTGFSWRESPEGHEYWEEIDKQLEELGL